MYEVADAREGVPIARFLFVVLPRGGEVQSTAGSGTRLADGPKAQK